MLEAATELNLELNLELTPAQIASLQQKVGGNPMSDRRVVREESLGLGCLCSPSFSCNLL